MSISGKQLLESLQDNKPYPLAHETIRLKAEHGLNPFIQCWGRLKLSAKEAFAASLSSDEVVQLAPFLLSRLQAQVSPTERAIVLRAITHYSGNGIFVEALIAMHGSQPIDIQRDIEWFLCETASAHALRFLRQLTDNHREWAYAEYFSGFLQNGDWLARIKTLVKRFHGFYQPLDEWTLCSWLRQFAKPEDQLLMLALLERVLFFDSTSVSEAYNELWSRLPQEVRQKAFVTGLGPQFKSGTHNLFDFRPLLDFNRKERVLALPSILKQVTAEPLTIVFIDDLIGTGRQAVKFYRDLLEGNDRSVPLDAESIRNLKRATKFYLSVAGFERGIGEIERSGIFGRPLVYRILTDSDRAFCESSRAFETIEDLRAAKELALFYGGYLYPPPPNSDPEGSPGPLGFGGCEALVVFHYNTPNNTLPFLWKAGARVGSRDWHVPFPRRE